MNRTLLIIIGLACALVAAAGIMWYEYNDTVNVARRQLSDNYHFEAFCTLNKLEHKDIIKLLQDNNPKIRSMAIDILINQKVKESIPEITKSLQDDIPNVRESAVIALMAFGTKEAIPEIKKLLNDENEDVRQWAEFALKQLGVPAEEIEKAKEETTNRSIKPDFIDFTGKVTSVSMHDRGPHSLADWLILINVTEVNKSDPKIQPGKEFAYWVHSPVQFFHEPGEDAIGKTYKFSVMRSRNEKGEKYPGLKVMDEIIKQRPLLHDKDASVRRKALSWLVAEADWESIPEIKKLLNDENEQVRKDAAEALEFFDRLEKHIQKNKEQK